MRISQHWMRRSAAVTAALFAIAACKPSNAARTGADSTGATGAAAAGGGTTASSGGEASGSQYQNVQLAALRPFNGDKQTAIEGRQLFLKYNCYGCHGGLAGGAMGPSLRDSVWKFGGTDDQIRATILQGRPAGMPAWKGVIPDSDISKIIVYIHSLRTSAEPTFFFAANDTTTKTAEAYK